MRTMHTNCFVELLAGYMKLLGPIVNVRRKLRIDDVRIVRAFFLFNFRFYWNFKIIWRSASLFCLKGS